MFMCLKVLNCQAASSANGDLDEAAANETTGILNDINGEFFAAFWLNCERIARYQDIDHDPKQGRSSLEDDLRSCATERQGVTVSSDFLIMFFFNLFNTSFFPLGVDYDCEDPNHNLLVPLVASHCCGGKRCRNSNWSNDRLWQDNDVK